MSQDVANKGTYANSLEKQNAENQQSMGQLHGAAMTRRYITIYKQTKSQWYTVKILIPKEHRAAFFQSPLASRMGLHPDRAGRVRLSMGRLTFPAIVALVDGWERQIDAAIVASLDADFRRVVRDFKKNNR